MNMTTTAQRVQVLKNLGFEENQSPIQPVCYKHPLSDYTITYGKLYDLTDLEWEKELEFIDYILSK